MRINLTVEDLGDLLEQPLVAVLATLRKDGSVLLSPIWHEWHEGGFNLWMMEDDVKTRHLRRDPRATIVLAESEEPYRGVEIRGVAQLGDRDVLEVAARIAARYLGEDGPAYVETLPGKHLIARLEPGNLRAWDFAEE